MVEKIDELTAYLKDNDTKIPVGNEEVLNQEGNTRDEDKTEEQANTEIEDDITTTAAEQTDNEDVNRMESEGETALVTDTTTVHTAIETDDDVKSTRTAVDGEDEVHNVTSELITKLEELTVQSKNDINSLSVHAAIETAEAEWDQCSTATAIKPTE